MVNHSMTARQQWNIWYRKARVLRREQRKAEMDLVLYGNSMLCVPNQGDPYHVPLAGWRSGRFRLPQIAGSNPVPATKNAER